MPSVLYIHGFLSSPRSAKAVETQQWLAQHRPDLAFICPYLPPYPDQAASILLESIEQASGPVGVMGSSLGGFWATWLVETQGMRALLINPSVNPMKLLPQFIGSDVENYHTGDSYRLTQQHLTELARYHQPVIKRHDNYWLLAQTGDETLDYRLAVEKYRGCRQTIEPGGDHSFQGFSRFIQQGVDFVTQDNP
ncbi:YqiA/YcfP family alpha/beta fold hydrolase [Simiduia agarivorans]|uniref:Esterase YqiA n=1 Tax=Simiduia agarivorans (strain DSM 21679 / JCM 13881 / BCRC 17597 / SA1) TaxID=1117647 RepID=K4KME0_SIMAS|nr:YqiA/YcfP family alpha/beta fold hydrolase [Simiduia agarivorans]AFU99400.1 hypothetical protein M5M_11115 [Simiduia agarivorans SA1 = DSM 21679]